MNKHLNRQIAVRQVADRLNISYVESSKVIKAFLAFIKRNVKKHNRVYLYDFGKFEAYHWPARFGHNVKTNQRIRIPSRWTVVFRPSSEFKGEMKANN